LSSTEVKSWRKVQEIVLGKISARQWMPGEFIPNEADLALELGCARTTVNRALRAVAETGLLDRKRKVGTKVTTNPVRKATISIPIIRQEIEDKNQLHSYTLIEKGKYFPPLDVKAQMGLKGNQKALRIEAVHYANNRPYVYEDRWINLSTVPKAENIDFEIENANEWLIQNAPLSRGDFSFYSINADKKISKILGTSEGNALLIAKRMTWNGFDAITSVKLIYHFGYEMVTAI
jgi:GntR family histidine utilization transcriptional repressor